jgi:predicted nucleotidyltransferase/DNA-binding XRE family transcriptional regulator
MSLSAKMALDRASSEPYILYEMGTGAELTPQACRAGRALVNIDQGELARRAGIARPTIADFERGARRPRIATLRALRSALERAGVAFGPDLSIARRAPRKRTRPPSSSERLSSVLRELQRAAPKLRRAGIRHLSVFGSFARGEGGPESDLDILIELDGVDSLDLFDYAGIVSRISDAVPGMVVDVAERNHLKDHVRGSALRDEIRVF